VKKVASSSGGLPCDKGRLPAPRAQGRRFKPHQHIPRVHDLIATHHFQSTSGPDTFATEMPKVSALAGGGHGSQREIAPRNSASVRSGCFPVCRWQAAIPSVSARRLQSRAVRIDVVIARAGSPRCGASPELPSERAPGRDWQRQAAASG